MSVDGDLLERIVSGVLNELRGVAPADAAVVTAAPRTPDAVLVTEKVITAELLEKTCGRSPRIVIGKNSLLTPSARDFLKQNRIDWTREAAASNSEVQSAAAKWKAIVVATTKNLANALDDAGKTAGAAWVRELAGCDVDAVDRAVSTICRAEASGVVVFTSHPDTVACRANRNSKVRGASVANAGEIRKVNKQMGANLICIDPASRSQMELNHLLREAAASGRPIAPKGWN